mgnify:CR=1 FL=1
MPKIRSFTERFGKMLGVSSPAEKEQDTPLEAARERSGGVGKIERAEEEALADVKPEPTVEENRAIFKKNAD